MDICINRAGFMGKFKLGHYRKLEKQVEMI
jgi:hypothetical protein